jgi:hypothetical protein
MAMKRQGPDRGRERRGSERVDARLSMRVETAAAYTGTAAGGSGRIVTESQNISSSGVYCHASHYLAPLSKVQITIILPRVPGGETNGQELLKCDGIVVRCDQRKADHSDTPYELACMFTGLDPTMRKRLEEFVTWRNLQALRAALNNPPRKVGTVVRPTLRPGGATASSAAPRKPGLKAAGSARTGATSSTVVKKVAKSAKSSAGRARG